MGIQYIGHRDGLPMILLQCRKVAAYRPASYFFLVFQVGALKSGNLTFYGHKAIYITILIFKNRLGKLEESSFGLSTIAIHVIGEINALMGIQYIGYIDGLPMILFTVTKGSCVSSSVLLFFQFHRLGPKIRKYNVQRRIDNIARWLVPQYCTLIYYLLVINLKLIVTVQVQKTSLQRLESCQISCEVSSRLFFSAFFASSHF